MEKIGWQDLTADFEQGFLKIMKDMDVEVQGSESPNKNQGPNLQGGNLGGDPHGIENGYARRDHKRSVCHGQPVNEQNG